MSIQGVLCTKSREAFVNGWVGTIIGHNIQNVVSYFVYGEGGFLTSTIPSETAALGNGTQTAFVLSLSHDKLVRGSITIVAGGVVGTDNGEGVITGIGISGSINYSIGKISINFVVPPGAAVPIVVSYSYKGVAATPDPSLLKTVAQSSPSDPTNVNHLAYFRKPFVLTGGSALKQKVLTPKVHIYCQMYLEQFEFLDDGRGNSPVIYEVGVFDTEDTILAYATFDGIVKDGATIINKKMRLYA
jgi:hypothetical protein